MKKVTKVKKVKKAKGKRAFLFCLFVLFTCHLSLFTLSANEPVGAAFLKIPVGARPLGMGGAFTAMANDATALHYNPAGLSQIPAADLVAAQNRWVADIVENFAGFAQRINRRQTIACGMRSLGMDPLERRDDQGRQTGYFKSEDRAITASLAWEVYPGLSIGASAKQIEMRLDDAKAKGRAFDFGVLAQAWSRLTLGVALKNKGNSMKFVNESFSLPTTLNFGANFMLTGSMALVADVQKPQTGPGSRKPVWNTGIEYIPFRMSKSYFWTPLIWRLGYQYPDKAAVGFRLKLLGSDVDYAVVPMPDLGFTHRVSFHVPFGKKPGFFSKKQLARMKKAETKKAKKIIKKSGKSANPSSAPFPSTTLRAGKAGEPSLDDHIRRFKGLPKKPKKKSLLFKIKSFFRKITGEQL
ncbi:PorV/PorQ family protein [Elusimicrobiota bacterium]